MLLEKRVKHREKNTVDMLHGPLFKKIVVFAIPLALSSMLQQLFNTADTAVLGKFAGADDMAAVGANTSVIALIVSLFLGISVGANVVIGHYIGQEKMNRVKQAVSTVMILSLISGGILLVAGLTLAYPILTVMDTPDNIMDLAVLYLRIYSLGMPFIMLYDFGSAILRSKGDSQRPMLSLIVAGVVNVSLNLLFVLVFHMGVVGVAIATVISNVISAAFILFFLLHEEGAFRLEINHLEFHKDIAWRVLKIGVPAGIRGMIFALSNTVIQSAVNGFGSEAVAGSTASQNLEYMCYYLVNAFNQSTTTFTSQNYGAGRYKRCKRIYGICIASAVISCGLVNVLLVVFHGPILTLFTDSQVVAAYAFIRMRHVLLLQAVAATYEVSAATMQGMGSAIRPTVLTIFGCVLFRIFWVKIVYPYVGSFEFLMAVYITSWIVTGALMVTSYMLLARRKFSNTRVEPA